jgi:hypothetical protein
MQNDEEFWIPEPDGGPPDTGAGAFDIESEFRRRLAGSRHYRGRERAAVRKAAYDWYVAAKKSLHERRRAERQSMRSRIALRRRHPAATL